MGVTRGRVENIVSIIGKDAASAEIDKAIRRLEKLKKEATKAGKDSKESAESAAQGFLKFNEQTAKGLATLGKFTIAAGLAFGAAKQVFAAAQEGAAFLDQLDILEKGVEGFAFTLERAQAATGGIISKQALVEGASLLKSFGVDLSDFDRIAEQVAKTSVTTGQSTEFLLDSIARGVARGSPKILDNLGIIVSIKDANVEYAKSLDRTVESLTAAEKQTALMSAVLEQLEENNTDVALTDSRSAAINKLGVAWEDAKLAVGGFVAEGLVAVLTAGDAATDALAGLNKALNRTEEEARAAADANRVFGKFLNRAFQGEISLEEALEAATAQLGIQRTEVDKNAEALDAMALSAEEATKQELILANAIREAAATRAGFADLAKAADKVAKANQFVFDTALPAAKGLSEEAKQARELAKALGITRRAARALVKEQQLLADIRDRPTGAGADFERLLAAEKRRTEASLAQSAKRSEARKKELAEEVEFTNLVEELAREEAEVILAEDKKVAEAKKVQSDETRAAIGSGVDFARKGLDLLGIGKKEGAALDAGIEGARSIASFAGGDIPGGLGHASAALAFAKIAGSGGPSGGARGGGAARRPLAPTPIRSTAGEDGARNVTINFAGFAVGTPQQLGSQLSGAVERTRGTGMNRAAAV